MLVHVVFRVEAAPPYGVPAWDDYDLAPIEMAIDETTVHIVPVMEVTEEELDEGHVEKYHHMTALRASVVLDVGDEPPGRDLHRDARRYAVQALRPVLQHLREATEDTRVDVHLATLRFERYADEQGNEVGHRPFLIRFPRGEVMREDTWPAVRDAVVSGKRVRRERVWLLEAYRYQDDSDFTMALTAAAISCEISLRDIVAQRLRDGGRVDNAQAEKFTEEVSKRQLPTFLQYLDLLDGARARLLVDIFEVRNAVLHGKRQQPIRPDRARDAIALAEHLLAMSTHGASTAARLPRRRRGAQARELDLDTGLGAPPNGTSTARPIARRRRRGRATTGS